MAGPNEVYDKSYTADGTISQFHVVTQTGTFGDPDHCREVNATGDVPLGVSQDAISADDVTRGFEGRAVRVREIGWSIAIADAAIGVGQPVTHAADGRVTVATVGTFILGRCSSPAEQADDFCVVKFTYEGVLA